MKVDLFTAESNLIKTIDIPRALNTTSVGPTTLLFHDGRFYVLDEVTRSNWGTDDACHYIEASIYFDSVPSELFPGLQTEPPSKPTPIPMLLWCPMCRERHIDHGEFATKPHRSHSCQHCGLTWRPAIEPTVGVQFLPGFKDPT